jgi:hypothetical protein
MTLLLWRMGMR